MIGRDLQTSKRPTHRQHAGLVDVDAVDFPHRCCAEGERYRALANFGSKTHPLFVGESLRIIDAGDGARFRGHDHGASDDGTGNRSTADFVDTGEQRALLAAKVTLDGSPARPLVDAPMADGFWVLARCFGGRFGRDARFDLFLHPATLSLKEERYASTPAPDPVSVIVSEPGTSTLALRSLMRVALPVRWRR